jgi:hypothetical protein
VANSDSAFGEFPRFAQLSGPHRYAVLLKAYHVRHRDIARYIEEEFGVKYSRYTINQYFAAGGLLEQAHADIRDLMADEWVAEARQLAKFYSKDAMETLGELIEPAMPPKIRMAASMVILNKTT